MVVLTSFKRSVICIGSFLFTAPFLEAVGFDNSRSDNLAVYYGQNSYGATHSDTANWQKTLSAYCQDDTINAIPLAFLHVFFSAGGLPEIDLASTCNSNGGNVFPGTRLARCPTLAGDIKACQARGKIVTISLGGATGLATFSSDAQARTFADTVWNLFLGGTSSTRPFADAILDGVDLDIEGGTGKGLAAFVTRIRELSNGASKRYYITAAPQCPFPDAYLGSAISAVGFDAIYVQYNNYCGANNYNNPNAWNFATWDNWAKTTSPNKNIKVYIGAPAASSAAGSGYIDAATLGRIAQETRSKYSSFGGIMLWDASQAYGNGRYDVAIKNAIGDGGATPTDVPDEECPAETTTTTKRSSTSVSTRTSTSNTSSATSRTSTKTSSTTSRTPSTTSRTSSTTSRISSTTSRTASTTSRTSSTTSKPSSTTTTSTRSSITTSTKTSSSPTSNTSSSPTSTPTQGSGSCAGVSSWSSYTIYIGANRVTHGGHLWTAKWWSLADTPGGGAGVWADNGACSSAGGTGAVTTSNIPAPTSGAESCSGTAAWGAGVTYVGGNKAVYNGHLWTAKWWAQGDTPGGRAGVWTDNGACSASTTRRRRRRSRVFRY